VRLETRDAALRGLLGELAGVEAQLLKDRSVLLVVDLLGKLVQRVLNLLALAFFAELIDYELFVQMHRLAVPGSSHS
jgi:hypothetical protein